MPCVHGPWCVWRLMFVSQKLGYPIWLLISSQDGPRPAIRRWRQAHGSDARCRCRCRCGTDRPSGVAMASAVVCHHKQRRESERRCVCVCVPVCLCACLCVLSLVVVLRCRFAQRSSRATSSGNELTAAMSMLPLTGYSYHGLPHSLVAPYTTSDSEALVEAQRRRGAVLQGSKGSSGRVGRPMGQIHSTSRW